jgi:hypothetical protein
VNLWDDFCLFARAEKLSGDADPSSRVLRRIYAVEKVDAETALWRSLVYLTWFHLGSAERVWTTTRRPAELDHVAFASLPVGVERRSFKGVGGNVLARTFVRSVLRRAGGALAPWVASFGSGVAGWSSARAELESVAGAGPWASWKWAELLRSVHGVEIVAPDVNVDGKNVAVKAALGALESRDAGDVLACLGQRGVELDGLDELRGVLVRFGALLKGAYYIGHDVDLQMEQLDGASRPLWSARDVFPAPYRGEKAPTPWNGVRRDLKKRYALDAELVNVWV